MRIHEQLARIRTRASMAILNSISYSAAQVRCAANAGAAYLRQMGATAATYRMLIANLKKEGVPTENLRPSTVLQPVLHKHVGAVVTAVNLLHPQALPPVQYKANILTKIGLKLLMAMIVTTAILAILESKFGFITGGLIVVSYLILWIGSKLPPKQLAFEGIITVRDLVNRIEASEKQLK